MKRMTPKAFAKFLLKEQICKNCKWWDVVRINEMDDSENYYPCDNYIISTYMPFMGHVFMPQGSFSCSQWEKKE